MGKTMHTIVFVGAFFVMNTVAKEFVIPAYRAQSSGASAFVIDDVTIVDVRTGALRPHSYVAIEGDRIRAVSEGRPPSEFARARHVDGAGRFLTPGLWDMHVHVLSPARIETFLPLLVANGVTGVRDMATELHGDEIARVRQRIADGSVIGPRMVVAGPLVSGASPGRPSGRADQIWAVTTPGEARTAVASLMGERVDFIKVYSYLKSDVFDAIAETARANHVDFAGHVPIPVNVLDAVQAGMRSIEHGTGLALACSSRESELREAAVRVMATGDVLGARRVAEGDPHQSIDDAKCAAVLERLGRAEVWQTPTIAYWTSITKAARGDPPDPAMRYVPSSARKRPNGQDWADQMRPLATPAALNTAPRHLAMLRRLRQAHARVLAGTDLGNPFLVPGVSLHDELDLIVSAGFSPLETLQTATLEPARYLRREADLGTIESGKIADLVLLDANPLESIQNARRVRSVVANGRLLDRAALDAILSKLETMR